MAGEGWFNRLLSEVRVRLPGAIDETIKLEMFAVFDEFFRTTHVWQETIKLGVTTDQTSYELDSNEWVATIHELLWVTNKDQIPVDASMEVAGILVLQANPPEDQTYSVLVSLSVADALDEDGFPQVPQWILIRYRDTFKDGILGRMMAQPSKPYYNEQLGTYHNQKFRTGMVVAYSDMKGKNTYNTQSWSFPQAFATTRRQ